MRRFRLLRRVADGAGVLGLVEADVFPTGVLAGGDAGDFGGWFVGGDAHFLVEFAECGGGVVFAGVEVAGDGRVPVAGVDVLEHRALLEEEVAAFVEDEDVDGAVEELSGVDVLAGCLSGDVVVFIDDVEDFAVFLWEVLEGVGVAGAGEFDPGGEVEFLGACGEGEVELFGDGGPVGAGRELFFELFPALGESAADEFVEEAVVEGGEAGLARGEEGDGRVDLGAGVEGFGRDGP